MAYVNLAITGAQAKTTIDGACTSNGILVSDGSGNVSALAAAGTAAQIAAALNNLMYISGLIVGNGNGTVSGLDTSASADLIASMITALSTVNGKLAADGSGNITAADPEVKVLEYSTATYDGIMNLINSGIVPVVRYTVSSGVAYNLPLCFYNSAIAQFRTITGSTTMYSASFSSTGTRSISNNLVGHQIDTALSTSSSNPVRNSVITSTVNTIKAGTLGEKQLVFNDDGTVTWTTVS